MNRTKSILSASQSTMTPMVLIVATLLSCLTACSSDNDSPDEPELQTSISFGAFLPEATNVEAGTRAEGLETKNTEFTVWAYKNKALISGDGTPTSPYNYGNLQTVMSQYKVQWAENTTNTTLTNTHNWDYIGIADQTIKYWDFDAKAYRFFGVTPSSAIGSTVNVTKATDESAVTLTITADASSEEAIAATPYFSRLWFSNNNINSSNKYAEVVQLEFIKPFAQVRVMFTYTEGLVIPHTSLTDISFKPVDNSKHISQDGTVTVTYPLTGTGTAETITTSAASKYLTAITEDYWVGDADDPAHLTWYTVFPIASQGVYQMTLNVEGVEKTAYVPAEFMSWDTNYSYTYIFKILESGIVFDEVQVGIKGWNSAETFNHPVYNW